VVKKKKSRCRLRKRSTIRFSRGKISSYFRVPSLMNNLLLHNLTNFICTFSILEVSVSVTEFEGREKISSLEKTYFNILKNVIGNTQLSSTCYLINTGKLLKHALLIFDRSLKRFTLICEIIQKSP
jgi:hypothetical protein